MKKVILFSVILFVTMSVLAQDMKTFSLYKPMDNAEQQISKAVKEANTTEKQVLIQIGGNWCVWCARFNDFVTTDKTLDSLVNSNYIVYHMNYSKENYNTELLKKYDFPQRFGFPVFLILNEKGDLIHTQTSWYLESGKGYDKEKVTAFLNDWSKKAFDPSQYNEQ